MGRDTFHQTRLLKAPSSLALNTAREGAARASLGNLCQGLTTLRVKNFVLVSNLNSCSSPVSLVVAFSLQHHTAHELLPSPIPLWFATLRKTQVSRVKPGDLKPWLCWCGPVAELFGSALSLCYQVHLAPALQIPSASKVVGFPCKWPVNACTGAIHLASDRQTDCPYLAWNAVISPLAIEKVTSVKQLGFSRAQPWAAHVGLSAHDSPSGNPPESQFTRLDSWPCLGGLYSPWLFGELQPSVQGAGTLHDESHTRMMDGQGQGTQLMNEPQS